jgi:hypothetical protein
MRYVVRRYFPTSNNVAEYEAFINGLRITIELSIRWLDIRGDSQLVIDQVMKESSCHNPKMAAYCQEVRKLEDKFDGLELNHILRWLKEAVDTRVKAASGREPIPMGVFASNQYKPLVRNEDTERASDEPPASDLGARVGDELPASALWADPSSSPSDPEVMEIDEDPVVEPDHLPDWRIPYLDCLIREVLPMDKTEARRLARRAKSFAIIEEELYKKGHTKIL